MEITEILTVVQFLTVVTFPENTWAANKLEAIQLQKKTELKAEFFKNCCVGGFL